MNTAEKENPDVSLTLDLETWVIIIRQLKYESHETGEELQDALDKALAAKA